MPGVLGIQLRLDARERFLELQPRTVENLVCLLQRGDIFAAKLARRNPTRFNPVGVIL